MSSVYNDVTFTSVVNAMPTNHTHRDAGPVDASDEKYLCQTEADAEVHVDVCPHASQRSSGTTRILW